MDIAATSKSQSQEVLCYLLSLDTKFETISSHRVIKTLKKLGKFEYDHQNGKSTFNYSEYHVKKFKTGQIFVSETEQDKLKQGRGIFIHEDGKLEEGTWQDGELTGKMRIVNTDRSYYIGCHDIKGAHDPSRIECYDKDSNMFKCKFSGKSFHKFANGTIYDGEWKDGLMHGPGTLVAIAMDEGVITGDWVNGEFKNGVRTLADGSKYKGEFDEHFRLHGKGSHITHNGHRYRGDWVHGEIQKGLHHVSKQYRYTGTFVDWEKSGLGKSLFSNGDEYSGEWLNDQRNGHGTSILDDGDTFCGNWQDDIPTGWGVEMFSDGSTYIGTMLNGVRQGYGQYKHSNGDEYAGEWVQGRRHGRGVHISDDFKYEGQFENSHFQGKGVWTCSNGDVHTGEFRVSLKHGFVKSLYADGRKYEGYYKDDLEHGEGTMTFRDGSKYEGGWRQGKYHGKGTLTTHEGVKETVKWREGRRVYN